MSEYHRAIPTKNKRCRYARCLKHGRRFFLAHVDWKTESPFAQEFAESVFVFIFRKKNKGNAFILQRIVDLLSQQLNGT